MKYRIAKNIFSIALKIFYSNVDANGLNKVPENQPVLFIANHSNAFIDPILLSSHVDRPVTFTAKSTLAKNPLLNLILKCFSVVLLSRRMDSSEYDSSRLTNAAALERLEAKLHNKGAVYIFPEGRSHNDAFLHEFKTGAARLALSYTKQRDSSDINGDLLVVPLGLAYSNKSVFRSSVSIQVGEPLSMNAWCASRPQADARKLTRQFKSMVECTLDTQKRASRRAALSVQAPVLRSSLRSRLSGLETQLMGALIGGIGWILNALAFALTAFLMRRLSSDHDHPASVAIVVGPLVFALVHGLQMFCCALFGTWFLALLYLLVLVPSTVLGLKAVDRIFNTNDYTAALRQN